MGKNLGKMLLGILFALGFFNALACDFEQVKFSKDFVGAKLDKCEKIGEQHYLLTSLAENRPINKSPWYAFKVNSKNAATEIIVDIAFDGNQPRYLPKISTDGKHWQHIPFDVVNKQFRLQLTAKQQASFIAGQEIVDNQHYIDWIAELSKTHNLESFELGKSTQGRLIHAFIDNDKNSKEWVLMVGRQHPPEVSGALAMLTFVDTIFEETELAENFRKRFNLFVVPNINPDGVAMGNWRHNAKGVDLNRDWANFTQVETRLVRDKLRELLNKKGKLVFGLDFHSTYRDAFYTIPSKYHIAPARLVEKWLDSLKQSVPTSFRVRPRPGVEIGGGVFKQYLADAYHVHGVTYEVGDNTERHLIDQVARKAAITFMQTMLDTPPSAFYWRERKGKRRRR